MKIFKVFMVMMFQVEVFWVVIPCSAMVGYHCFRGPCCFHLHSTAWFHNPEDLNLKDITKSTVSKMVTPSQKKLIRTLCFSIKTVRYHKGEMLLATNVKFLICYESCC
jgi:hypothetical protein